MAAMIALGDLPPVDALVHADTSHEKEGTYRFREQWEPWLRERGQRVETVTAPARELERLTHITAFTTNLAGGRGQIKRQCTRNWKIDPLKRFAAAELSRRGLTKHPGIVEQWLGITSDEWQRAKDSPVQYIKSVFPLLDLRLSRNDCVRYLQRHDLPVPVKSSCVFCPFQSKRNWQDMKRAGGTDWVQAVTVDRLIRHGRKVGELFVHSSRRPLDMAVKDTEAAEQASFLDDVDDECDGGHCFL
ncbi:MAG: hypothetical protein NTZ05_16710 [Chloroflexi bacterium]|nr:hypothetical protein [Chloroflexota bacterium]